MPLLTVENLEYFISNKGFIALDKIGQIYRLRGIAGLLPHEEFYEEEGTARGVYAGVLMSLEDSDD